MNKDQIEGSVKNIAGKAQRKMGQIVGSDKQQLKGVTKEIEGKIQKSVGNAKETIKDASKDC
jgi:uncharacterized protein YjbJ (UPF0337 family)